MGSIAMAGAWGNPPARSNPLPPPKACTPPCIPLRRVKAAYPPRGAERPFIQNAF